jgi:methionyl-tRNA synthetase
MTNPYFLTTPLYYVNGVPHVGHAYTTVIADAIARYRRMCGSDVCFLTGTDEHGLKIERAAGLQKVSPQELTDKNAAEFKVAWDKLGISYDEFIRTTELRHHETVQEIFKIILDKGFIYLGEYSGQYCVRCELYVPKGEEKCPDCGGPTEFIKEDSYFFKLSAFQDKLLEFYADNPNFVIPETRMNEIVSLVRGGLKDVSISRTSFTWGIPIPKEKNHIFYVWFDALNGYLSGAGYGKDNQSFEKFWPAEVQLIGKDIVRFHGVYWPAFLMAAGLEPPHHLLVHGWWTVNDEKMSKSLGNFITVDALLRILPRDYLKYFLLREIPLGADGNFSADSMLTRVNSDLANDLGNLASRVLTMIDNYFEGAVPSPGEVEGADKELIRFCKETVKLYHENFDSLKISRALENVWELISVCNKYIVANEPWSLAKDSAKTDRLARVLYNSAEAVRVISILLWPIIPDGTGKILEQLGVIEPAETLRNADLKWGILKAGAKIGKIEPVYPRLNKKQFLASVGGGEESESSERSPAAKKTSKNRIGIADFARVEIRVAKILEAERVPKSAKLIKLKVDIGTETRQVVAGIGKAYSPEELVGRVVAVVTNLEPAKLMGLESNGMIVAAEENGKPVLTTFTEPVAIGSRLK